MWRCPRLAFWLAGAGASGDARPKQVEIALGVLERPRFSAAYHAAHRAHHIPHDRLFRFTRAERRGNPAQSRHRRNQRAIPARQAGPSGPGLPCTFLLPCLAAVRSCTRPFLEQPVQSPTAMRRGCWRLDFGRTSVSKPCSTFAEILPVSKAGSSSKTRRNSAG